MSGWKEQGAKLVMAAGARRSIDWPIRQYLSFVRSGCQRTSGSLQY